MFALVTLLMMSVMRAGPHKGSFWLSVLSQFKKSLRDKKHRKFPCFFEPHRPTTTVLLLLLLLLLLLSVVGCGCCRLSVVGCRLSVVRCPLSVVRCPLSVVGCRLSVVCCLLSVVCCLLSVVCCLLLLLLLLLPLQLFLSLVVAENRQIGCAFAFF